MSTKELVVGGSEIRRLRAERGLSMRQLADLLEVTPAAVQQYEKSELSGTIHLNTLRKALAALDADLTLIAKPRKKSRVPKPATNRLMFPTELLASTPKPHRTKERVLFRAKSRVRTGAIVADAAVEGSPLTPSELWAIVEGTTVGGHLVSDQQRVRSIRDKYDVMVRKVAAGEKPPALAAPSGEYILPDPAIVNPFARAIELAARAIAKGVNPVDARLAANAELLDCGLDAVVLKAGDRQRHNDATKALREQGDAGLFARLMLDRYSEDD